jgi:hypothetical protein
MRRLVAISLITLGLSLSLSAQEHTTRPPTSPPTSTPSSTPAPGGVVDSSGWVKFISEEGRFSVLMPKIPTDKTETKDSSHGPFTTHLFITKDPSRVFLIGWVDYDPGFDFNPQAELEANRDNFVSGIKATLLTTRGTRIDGYSAIEFEAEAGDRVFRSRVYMVGRRPYQIVIGSPKGMDDSASVNRFFNSFKVRLR